MRVLVVAATLIASACGGAPGAPYPFGDGVYGYALLASDDDCPTGVRSRDPINVSVDVGVEADAEAAGEAEGGAGSVALDLPMPEPSELNTSFELPIVVQGVASTRALPPARRTLTASVPGPPLGEGALLVEEDARILAQSPDEIVVEATRAFRVEGRAGLFGGFVGPCRATARFALRLERACDEACMRTDVVGGRARHFCPCSEAPR